jgi:hypothetical protein
MSSLYLESLVSKEKKETSQQLPLLMMDNQGNLQQSVSGKKVQGKIIWKSRKRGSQDSNQNELPPYAVEDPESSDVTESRVTRNYLDLSFTLSVQEFVPFQRATIINYCHFLLYQCGFTPLPFHQLKEIVENEIINNVYEESRSRSFKSLQKQRKLLRFVSQLQDAFSGIDSFLFLYSSRPKNGSILPILKFGVGIGPSVNNLKKIFFLNFCTTSHNNSSDHLPEMNVPKKTSDKWKRMLLHKLIEFQSTNDGCFSVGSSSSSSSSSSSAVKNGNIYLFFQVASEELLSSSSSSTDSTQLLQNDLLKFFSFSHSVPFSSHFLQQQLPPREEERSSFPREKLTHREKQIQKKLFHLNIELGPGSSKTMEFSDSDNAAGDGDGDRTSGGGWFVLRKGIKVLKVSL